MPSKSATVTGLPSSSGFKTLAFGLVQVHVGLIPMLDEPDGSSRPSGSFYCSEHEHKITQPKWCSKGEHIVSDPVKGYKWNGKIVFVPEATMKSVALDKDPVVTLQAMVETIDPSLFLKGYFLQPPDPGAVKPYKLLRNVLKEHNAYLVGTMIDSGTNKVLALRYSPEADCIVGYVCAPLQLMRTNVATKIKNALSEGIEPSHEEQALAEQIFQAFPTTFDLASVEDTLGNRQWAIIAREAGEKAEIPKPVEIAAHEDLLEALRASAKSVSKQGAGKPKARRKVAA